MGKQGNGYKIRVNHSPKTKWMWRNWIRGGHYDKNHRSRRTQTYFLATSLQNASGAVRVEHQQRRQLVAIGWTPSRRSACRQHAPFHRNRRKLQIYFHEWQLNGGHGATESVNYCHQAKTICKRWGCRSRGRSSVGDHHNRQTQLYCPSNKRQSAGFAGMARLSQVVAPLSPSLHIPQRLTSSEPVESFSMSCSQMQRRNKICA